MILFAMSILDLDKIETRLQTSIFGKGGTNELWDEIVSTNDRAAGLSFEGAAEGTMVIARQQSGGRGRQGRSWISPKDSGIFVSFIMRPIFGPSVIPLISFAGGVAAAEAIEKTTSIRIGLKWVNDLVFEGKKLGGILAEKPAAEQSSRNSGGEILLPPVILGIGINLSLEDNELPPELKGRVVSIGSILGKPVDPNELVAAFSSCLEDQYNHLSHGGYELVLEDWKKYAQTLGRRIRAKVDGQELEGIAVDLADSGALILRLDTGEEHELHAGEISIRLANGDYA